jgi:Glycosyl transferase family 2
MHRAPVGFVHVATQPRDTLTERARTAAETTLAEQLRHHSILDDPPDLDSSKAWPSLAACPSRFPTHGGAGVSAVVCTRNRTELLTDALRTLRDAAYDPLEILVVDNAPPSDATKDVVLALRLQDPRVRYTCEPVPGLSRARNRGLAEAQFDISRLHRRRHPDRPGLASRHHRGRSRGDLRDRTCHVRHPGHEFTAFDPLLGAAGPCRGGEDLDMLLRIILAGGRICYLPSAMVWHLYHDDTMPLGQEIYSYGHGLGAYLAKHLTNPQMRAALVRQGFRQVGVVLTRMRQASQAGRPREGSRRLVLNQAEGVVIGALRYCRAAHRAPGSS